jgi:DNA topoisomerase IB
MRDTPSSMSQIKPAALETSAAAGLRYVSDTEPGITRIRRGKGFRYVGPDGKPITDRSELQRIRKLAIPPAYGSVWICVHPRGHIQATGRDARGRKQYRYHPLWRESRDRTKFDRMIEFAVALPKLRRRLQIDLVLSGLPRDKVLAVIVSLLDSTRIRIGNAEYARSNNSFGLTTLKNRHVKFLREGHAVFDFRGKGGVRHEVEVDDRRLARIVRHCQELPGQQLFQYVDTEGQRHAVDSTLVNEYLQEVMGQDFTAKDFRTWNATLLAIQLLRETPLPERPSERAFKSCVLNVIRAVATELRNTPAVCRKAYINPVVFDAWRNGSLQRLLKGRSLRRSRDKELAALHFLKKQTKSKRGR